MTNNINDIQDEIIEEFSMLDDWMDRYALLIDYGKELPAFPEEERTDQNLIDGCQSKVWLTAHMDGNRLVFAGDSDALLVKGIVALLMHILSATLRNRRRKLTSISSTPSVCANTCPPPEATDWLLCSNK